MSTATISAGTSVHGTLPGEIMLTRTIAAVTLGFTLLVGIATSAIAEPITFNFTMHYILIRGR